MQAYLGKATVCDFIGELSNATAASILLRGVIGEKLIAVRRFTRTVSPDSCSSINSRYAKTVCSLQRIT